MAAMSELIARLKRAGIKDQWVLAAIEKVPREQFVAAGYQHLAQLDQALPIEAGQTISQPYVVALMTELLTNGQRLSKVLEIGTGSGYQTAILAELVDEVFTIERVLELSQLANVRLQQLGCRNVHLKHDDGMLGWSNCAPYNGIIVTAGAEKVPQALLQQLAEGGRLIMPIGTSTEQHLLLVERKDSEFVETVMQAVMFVPLRPGKA